ncbi:hypothetical protein QJS66_03770 [Kocuria rhizophila]|nr:hypothetical protein QJS66_03770 [Kocuria rhizophila]
MFATYPGWEALDDGQRVSAVVTVASTATPPGCSPGHVPAW